MKKVICFIILLSFISKASAQDLTISFQPKVSGTKIDSIRATNLRTNQFVKLIGGESFVLVKTPTGINSLQYNPEAGYIYPNPTDGDATFCFSTNKTQEVEIRLYNLSGKLLNQNRQHLEQGTHRFKLKFPVAGIYYLSVLKSDGLVSFKAIYTGSKIQNCSIQYAGSEKSNSQKSDANQLKGATTAKTLAYSDGDFIQYSVSSGLNTTILTETPTVSKAFEVEFVSCIDKDNRSYKVVKIGSQWWMAENLAYLPVVSPPSEGSKTSPYCYVYDYSGTNVTTAKSTANYVTYGVLYNWPAALATCPPGWHLPGDNEWTALTTFLGGKNVAGGKIKESGYTHWLRSNAGATNETGFAALPAGYRNPNSIFSGVGNNGFWWSSTEENPYFVWCRYMYDYDISIYRNSFLYKEDGFSVRCVRD